MTQKVIRSIAGRKSILEAISVAGIQRIGITSGTSYVFTIDFCILSSAIKPIIFLGFSQG